MTRPTTAETLIKNLTILMAAKDWSNRDLAKKSGVSDRHIGKILNRESVCSIDIAEKLAQAFDLTGWQLITPNLAERLPDGKRLEKMVSS